MFRAIRNLVSKSQTTARRSRTQLTVDRLPDRINPVITDMTGMSMYFPTHDGPTTLFINFDGCDNLGGHTVAPFTGSTKDKADILYRVSEEFAPFNVQVRREYGFGSYDDRNGATTIFVGDDRGFDRAIMRADGSLIGVLNTKGGITPGAFMDTPYRDKADHAPNSNAYDLAFVDPVEQSSLNVPLGNAANTWISRAICHETGHTLGLAHVLGGATNDVMSYNSSNDFFANKDLPVTTLNYNPSTGSTDPDDSMQPVFTDPNDGAVANITTQNSFSFLGSMLDWRPAHQPRVAHRELVDSSVYKNFSGTYGTSFTRDVDLGAGDYRVYHIQPGSNVTAVDIRISRTSGGITPMALVYRDSGAVEFYDSKYLGNGQYEVQTRLDVTGGKPFDLVVGGFGGSDSGRLHVEVSRPLGSLSNNTSLVVSSPAGSFGASRLLSSTVGSVVGTTTGTLLGNFGSGSAILDAQVWESVYSSPQSMFSAKLTMPGDYAPIVTDPITSDDPMPTDEPAPVDESPEPVADTPPAPENPATDEPAADLPAADEPAPVDPPTEAMPEEPVVTDAPATDESALEQSPADELAIDDPTMIEPNATDAAPGLLASADPVPDTDVPELQPESTGDPAIDAIAVDSPTADAALEGDALTADGANLAAVSFDAGDRGAPDALDNANEPSAEAPAEPMAVLTSDASADPLLQPNS